MQFQLRWFYPVLVAGAVLLTGCEGDDDGGNSLAQVAGTWSLTQSFSTGRVVTFSMTLAQDNGNLTGTSSYGNVSGSVSGSSVNFTIQDEDLKTFTGQASGETMSGTFTENFEDELFRNGSWTATRTSS